MCSIISCKINKDLINIIRSFLLTSKNELKEEYSKIISTDVIYKEYENDILSELLRKCYLLQMKRRFPQKEYIVEYECVKFHIPNLSNILDTDPIFTENKYINSYIHIREWESTIYFFVK